MIKKLFNKISNSFTNVSHKIGDFVNEKRERIIETIAGLLFTTLFSLLIFLLWNIAFGELFFIRYGQVFLFTLIFEMYVSLAKRNN
jgi:hypothetical protein